MRVGWFLVIVLFENMQQPDANGFINIKWPSKTVPHGGLFHTAIVNPSDKQTNFLKVLLQESKLDIQERQKYKLRKEEEKAKEAEKASRQHYYQPQVRPRTSRRRSLSCIKESGIYDIEPFLPTKRGEDREKLKDRLAYSMEFGDTSEPVKVVYKKPPPATPKLPTNKERWQDLVSQIRERVEWLAEMEALGQAGEYSDQIHDQIAERMRMLDTLGIDVSECSTTRSDKSGFSTLRSREPVSSKGSDKSGGSRLSNASKKSKQSAVRSTAGKPLPENIASLKTLQYSPRRRV